MSHLTVVGCTGSIGAAVARALTDRGHSVTGTYAHRRPDDTSTLKAVAQWDASDWDGLPGIFEQFEQAAGPMDGLVYCSGILRDRPFSRVSRDELMLTLSVNVIGAFRAAEVQTIA